MSKGLLLAVAFAALACGCASLPPPTERTPSTVLAETADTRLGRAVAVGVAAHPGRTGTYPLVSPHDAFAARVLLAAAAERSLDVQYYIWHADQSGVLLFEALWRAAERGVRVRLLLDDMNTRGLDATLAALDAHPRIEVRLYNPFVQRDARAVAFLTDFARVNRRMHNKSFTADGQVSVVGGRNVGNEYFGAGSGVVFADLDVIVAGAAVGDVGREFDLYWNSPSAYPAAGFVGTASAEAQYALERRFIATRADPDARAFLEAVRTTPVIAQMLDGTLDIEWTPARVVHDDPAKTTAAAARADDLLFPALVEAIGKPARSLELVSPYFVPGEEGARSLAAMARRGVQVRVLTNSLASTDESVVHGGYARRRVELLRAGVRLFELRPTAETAEGGARMGSSASAGLHAKTFAVDGARMFVGSFNFDQRSLLLNTEMGLVIESRRLAQRLADFFDREVPRAAYEVRLAPGGRSLQWLERTATGETVHATEPGTTFTQRMRVEFLSILPIEWLL